VVVISGVDPNWEEPFLEIEAAVDGEEYNPPRQDWPPKAGSDLYILPKWPEGELRSISRVARYIGKPESTVRDVIKSGEIRCKVSGISKQRGYFLHGRMRYQFTKDQYKKAKRYFEKKDRDKALRLLIIREYRKKRVVGEDSARQWIYRKMRENPELTLDNLKSQVDKMKKRKVSK
jgi:hypothetical protein